MNLLWIMLIICFILLIGIIILMVCIPDDSDIYREIMIFLIQTVVFIIFSLIGIMCIKYITISTPIASI